MGARGSLVIKALSYTPLGRGLETRWGERIFSIYLIPHSGPGIYSTSNRNELNNASGE
jgi:hypothetical protein